MSFNDFINNNFNSVIFGSILIGLFIVLAIVFWITFGKKDVYVKPDNINTDDYRSNDEVHNLLFGNKGGRKSIIRKLKRKYKK